MNPKSETLFALGATLCGWCGEVFSDADLIKTVVVLGSGGEVPCRACDPCCRVIDAQNETIIRSKERITLDDFTKDKYRIPEPIDWNDHEKIVERFVKKKARGYP